MAKETSDVWHAALSQTEVRLCQTSARRASWCWTANIVNEVAVAEVSKASKAAFNGKNQQESSERGNSEWLIICEKNCNTLSFLHSLSQHWSSIDHGCKVHAHYMP